MSPLQDTDVFGVSRNDPQTAGTYKVTLASLRQYIGTPQGAVKPDWNADPTSAAGILNRPGAATAAAQGLMSGADKAKLDGLGNVYVAKAGDTMTGNLNLSRCLLSGDVTRNNNVVSATTPDGDSLNLGFWQNGEVGLAAKNDKGIYLSGGSAGFRPTGGGGVDCTKDRFSIGLEGGASYVFEATHLFSNRTIIADPGDSNFGIEVRANNGGHVVTRFSSQGGGEQWAQIDAQNFRTDYAGRKEVWIRAAQQDQTGFVQLHGGTGGTPIVISAGSETNRIADIDTGGNWHATSDRKAKTAIRGIALGLEAVLKMRPVAFHYKAEVEAKGGHAPDRLGFIAQEMEEVVPEAVKVNEDGLYTLAPTLLIPVLVRAIQELTARVQQLEGAA